MEEQAAQQRARERAALMDDIQHGRTVDGLGEQIGKVSKTVESTLREKGTGPEASVADILEAQRRLIEEKDLANRFMRIGKRIEALRGISGTTPDFASVQEQMESLRPLVMLIIRSPNFRTLMTDTLRLAKKLIERNMPKGAEDKVANTTEQQGIREGIAEAKEQAKQTAQNIEKKAKEEKLLTDEEWQKLSDELDATFCSLQQHARYRDGVDQLFNLGSFLRHQFTRRAFTKQQEEAVTEVKKEAIGIVAEFSGEKVLNDLVDMINSLFDKFQHDERVNAWWEEFKTHTQKILKSYKDKEELEEYRKMFNEGYDIFEDYADDLSKVIDQMSEVVDNITNDKLVKDLRERVGSISDDLMWKDAQGNAHVDTGAAKSLAATVTEAMRKEFKYLALPSINYNEGDTHLELSEIIVNAQLPDNISFHLESFANFDLKSWNLSKPGRPDLGTEIYLTTKIENITFEMLDANFKYKGTIISDAGQVSIRVPKPGADLTIDFVLRPFEKTDTTTSLNVVGTEDKGAIRDSQGRYSFVKVKTNLHMPKLDVKFKEEDMKHPYLLPTVTSLFKRSIISEFEGIIERLLNDGLKGLGEKVAKILNQAENPLSLSTLGERMTGLGGVESFVE